MDSFCPLRADSPPPSQSQLPVATSAVLEATEAEVMPEGSALCCVHGGNGLGFLAPQTPDLCSSHKHQGCGVSMQKSLGPKSYPTVAIRMFLYEDANPPENPHSKCIRHPCLLSAAGFQLPDHGHLDQEEVCLWTWGGDWESGMASRDRQRTM